MKAFEAFKDMDSSFWAFVKIISEKIGYTDRGLGMVRGYTPFEIRDFCSRTNIMADEATINDASRYSIMRANLLNNHVEGLLMDAASASQEYMNWERVHRLNDYLFMQDTDE
ncbi:MAG: hypothetical protein Q4A32_09440 [Lachnospiraceae bacterium]|nr:hypothetical protein [Lachnospiraceae bacterium]